MTGIQIAFLSFVCFIVGSWFGLSVMAIMSMRLEEDGGNDADAEGTL